MSRGIVFCVFIFNLAIQPSICFSEAGLHSEKMNMTGSIEGAESDLGINKDYTSMTQNQYILGRLLGTLSGFGIGHAVQGRWFEKGWIFTGLTLGLPFVAVPFMPRKYKEDKIDLDKLLLIVTFTFLGLKVWEAVDVWSLPSHYKIVQEPKLSISPFLLSARYCTSGRVSLTTCMASD